jgi:hypothetical protein
MTIQQVNFMTLYANENAPKYLCLELFRCEVYIYASYDDDITNALRKILEALERILQY